MKTRLYVGNLAYSVTGEQLRDMFTPHGEVNDATVIADRDTGRSKGFGFVEMGSEDGARKAIEALHEAKVAGRNLIVNEARDRDSRPERRPSRRGGR
ncbi:MAG: RNA-binding protein [Calditrichaeota bacterium]|nr:RNA-binding protein [Calditrichota bacterium]